MEPRERHFVTFVSPGTLFPETTTKPIETWDVARACEMAREVTERHAAKPYSFVFLTRLVADPIPDGRGGTLAVEPKEVGRSGNYFLGGTLLTLDKIRARSDPKLNILITNMECSDFPIVIENTNSWRATLPFGEGDAVVNPASGAVVRRGNEPELKEYRKRKIAEHRREIEAAIAAHSG